jgi:hypothetical protein
LKKKIPKPTKKVSKKNNIRSILAIVIILLVAAIGYKLFIASHAATPYVSSYASAGKLSGTATLVADTSSESGDVVKFEAPVTCTSNCGTTGTGAHGGCTSGGVVAPCIGSATTGASGWGTPTFDDEFTSDSSLNTSDWTPYWYSNGTNQNGTNMYSSNVSIANGYLNLDASGGEGSSGGLISSNPSDGSGHKGFEYTYGFMEVSAYIPASGSKVANWPAIWAVGADWPEDGELDVMEGLSGSACYHFHYGSGSGSQVGGCASGTYTGWHTFAANWQPGSVTYYYDGVEVGQDTGSYITTEPMYIILENSTGSYGLIPVTTPTDMQVAYVRVWHN